MPHYQELHIEELLLHALPHHPIIIQGCKEFQSRIPGLEGEAWILTLHVRYPRTFADSLRSCAFIPQTPKTLKLTAIISLIVKIYFILSYHFSNLARLALEPLTKRFTLLLTMYLGQMIRYRSNDGTKDLVLFGSQVVTRISPRKMALRFRLFGILSFPSNALYVVLYFWSWGP